MRSHNTSVSTAILLACATLAQAQSLPYNPTFLIQDQNANIYKFSPDTNPQFSLYDAANKLHSSDAAQTITTRLPFDKNGTNSFIPVLTKGGLNVFSGQCSQGTSDLELWTYGFGPNNKTWTQVKTTSSNLGLSANFLAAAFTFPSSQLSREDSLYVFGGMCPSTSSNASAWTANAAYSNTMITISPEHADDYGISLTGTRSPPIAEAGLTITPLVPNSFTAENTIQQQNFVLLGGHTRDAFINMSQVAMFSLPEQAWAFIGINQPASTVVEPRSGHTAVISEDGSRIVVFGGWVGNTTQPATPQLAVLELGQGYGGNGSWSWVVPNVKTQYSLGTAGVYGHGATMLPGDVMMVSGGYSITSNAKAKAKRDTQKTMFFNLASSSWSDSYVNSQKSSHDQGVTSGLNSQAKTGLGAGLGLGITAVIVLVVVVVIYTRRKRQQKKTRERQLRELALGTNDAFSTADVSRPGSRGVFTNYRSASWGDREERRIGGTGNYHNDPSGVVEREHYHDSVQDPITTGMLDVPGPQRRMSNSLRSRGPPGLGNYYNPAAPGVFTIEEVEERSERGSMNRSKTAESRPTSDPFKDPLHPETANPAAEERRQEVQTWVDDWQYAAESMHTSRNPSKANSKAYSTLSVHQSASSGEKSDRTNSDLSERSNRSDFSIQQSQGGLISRTVSQRSGNAGYALFSTAAAAMSRLAGRTDHTSIERSSSKRAVSTGDLAQMAASKRSNSMTQSNPPLRIETSLRREESNRSVDDFEVGISPIKDYKHHARQRSNSFTSQSTGFTSQGKRAFGVLGQGARRILTGTSNVSVQDKVSSLENRSRDSSPTKHSGMSEMAEVSPQRVSSSGAAFWRHKQGAKDWEDPKVESSNTFRRRSGRVQVDSDMDGSSKIDDDWDIETAIQQRVVQVMFTVPKEKLRVVNADNLSLLSRSDTHVSRESEHSEPGLDNELHRMSRMTEVSEEASTMTSSALMNTNTLHPSSATRMKGKERLTGPRPQRSGEMIGHVE